MRLQKGTRLKLNSGNKVVVIKFVDNDNDCGWLVTDGAREFVIQRSDVALVLFKEPV